MRILRPQFEIGSLLKYLESTPEDTWCTDVCRRADKNCLFGHIFNWGEKYKESWNGFNPNFGSHAMNWFEQFWATTYMFYAVNDGSDKRYPQTTPKQRCIQYIKDLISGKAKTTIVLEEEYEKEYFANHGN